MNYWKVLVAWYHERYDPPPPPPTMRQLRRTQEYKDWAKAVRKRDNYICQRCGKHGSTAHHIQKFAHYPDLRTDIDNGETLCTKCHRKHHQMEDRNAPHVNGRRQDMSPIPLAGPRRRGPIRREIPGWTVAEGSSLPTPIPTDD